MEGLYIGHISPEGGLGFTLSLSKGGIGKTDLLVVTKDEGRRTTLHFTKRFVTEFKVSYRLYPVPPSPCGKLNLNSVLI